MIIDTLIPDDLTRDAGSFYKARILVAIIIIYVLITSGIWVWIFFSGDTTRTGKLIGITTLLGMQAGYIIAMLALRLKSWFAFAAHFTIFLTAAGIVCGILVSGGPMTAPAISMNILPIFMAFVLVGKRAGLIWTQIILSIHVIFLAAAAYGYPFMQVLDPETLPLQHLAHWLVTYSAMISMMFVYDLINSRVTPTEQQMLEHLATHDPLTHLPNRMQFDINLGKSMNRDDRHKTLTAVLFIDLHQFRLVNEQLGRDAGDLVLETISRRLENLLGKMDTVARLGGNEFGIILENIRDTQQLVPITNKLLRTIAKPIQIRSPNRIARTSGRIGIALFPLHGGSKEELLRCVDLAMANTKATRREYTIYSDKLSGTSPA